MRLTSFVSSCGLLTAIALAGVTSNAQAQTPAPATTPAPAPAPAAPAPAPAPAAVPDSTATPGQAAAAPAAGPSASDPNVTAPSTASEPAPLWSPPPASEAPLDATAAPAAEEEETWPAAWFRIDSDIGTLQLWAGATHMLSDSIGIATDMYVNSATYGEFDIGPTFVAGPLYVTPMIGAQADWAAREMIAIVPQLYVTGGPDPIYTELWVQNYRYNVFDKANGHHTLYFRFFIDYKVSDLFAIGPQIEASLALNDNAQYKPDDSLVSLPIGGNIMLPNYGKGNNFFLFVGYDTQDDLGDSRLAGRLTFVRNF